ncbi:MAG: EamA family transporter RarD [Rhodobacteraceae bacterium]|nr:EamA family transporter RarD [Paracoccaceae bacterium]
MPAATAATASGDTLAGLAYALSAYLLWGFLPFYMKAVAHIPTVEVLAHRVLWSLPIAGAVLVALGRTADLRAALGSPRMLAQGALTAALISVNWAIYVWAIGAGRALDTALGYYINPLFSVFLGAALLGERLSRAQWAAIALAAGAVGLLTWETGDLPWVAVALPVTWGFYALFRKTLPIGPNQGFFLEILILSPPALGYVLWHALRGGGHFLAGAPADTALLLGCGVVTAVPLMLYANGAKLLRLSTIAMMQYLAPTMIFLIAVFAFREPFPATRLAAFAMIWAALALYSGALWAGARARVRGG